MSWNKVENIGQKLKSAQSPQRWFIIPTVLFVALFVVVIGLICSDYIAPKVELAMHQSAVRREYEQIDHEASKNSANHAAKDVTMVQLLATPEKYDGWLVRVVGVGNLGFEANYIALTKEDWGYYSNHRISVSLSERAISYEEAAAYNGKYVLVEGIFRNDSTGKNDVNRMTIENVSRYQLVWKEKENIE